jgi:hypothetical protein
MPDHADALAVKLPFPLTVKFKSMLQAGVATRDMDPRWMSSISWYFLCIFGLQSVFNFLLGSDNGTSPSIASDAPSPMHTAPYNDPLAFRPSQPLNTFDTEYGR